MTRLHTSAHTDVTSTLLSRIGRIGRVFARTQPSAQPIAQANPGGWAPALDLDLPHPSEVPLHESFTQSWGELALQAHGRGEHEGRRYSLVCPACRALPAAQ